MGVRLQFRGTERAVSKIDAKLRRLTGPELREVFRLSANELAFVFRRNVQRFTPGGAPDLSPKYRARKERLVGYAYPILYRTGVLMAALYTRAIAPTSGHVWTIRYGFDGTHPDRGIDLGRLAEIHIDGEGRNPKRDFTKLSNEWRMALHKRVKKLLEG